MQTQQGEVLPVPYKAPRVLAWSTTPSIRKLESEWTHPHTGHFTLAKSWTL